MNSAEKTLFVHGWATDSASWDGHEALSRGEVIKIDLPGHGSASLWDTPTLSPAVGVIFRALSVCSKKSVRALGWSLGALSLIAAAIEEPERFRSLVLVGATPCFVSRDGFTCGQSRPMVRRMLADMKKEPRAALERFYPLNFTSEELRERPAKEFMERYRYPGPIRCDGAEPGCFPAFRYGEITEALKALYMTDLRERLALLDLPVLLVHGDRDEVCPVGAGKYLAKEIRGARMEIIDNTGHAPHITRPEEFDSIVRDFYNER